MYMPRKATLNVSILKVHSHVDINHKDPELCMSLLDAHRELWPNNNPIFYENALLDKMSVNLGCQPWASTLGVNPGF